MKWNIQEGISFKRGTHMALIAEYDNSPYKFEIGASSTTSDQKAKFKRFGEYIGAKQCTITIRDFDTSTLKNHLEILVRYDGTWLIRKELEVEEGAKREFIKYSLDDILSKENRA